MRIRVSWLFLLLITTLFVLSTSAWEVRNASVAELFFIWGIILAGIGAFGRLWSSIYIAGYKNRNLITTGPYSLCRNPLYFFSFVGSLGVGLTTETLTIPFIIGIVFAAYYPFVIRAEEQSLLEIHGSAYADYQKQVPRFIPNLKLIQEPEQYAVQLGVFRKHLFSAIWFIWLPAGSEFVEMLHATHVIPSWFLLY